MTDAADGSHVRARGEGASGGSKRDLSYPPLPQALVVPVYDNHTHMEIADGVGEGGDGPLDYREHLDRASSVGVRGVVQVGTDLATSEWSAQIAAREPRVLAAVALHPNEAPVLDEQGLLDEHLAGIERLAALPRSGRSARPVSTSSAPARTAVRRRSARSRSTSGSRRSTTSR